MVGDESRLVYIGIDVNQVITVAVGFLPTRALAGNEKLANSTNLA